MVELEINQKLGKKIPKIFWLKLASKTLKLLKNKNQLKISLAIISEAEIKKYNKIYLGHNRVTDVLSFGEKQVRSKFPDDKNFLGEILICYTQAARQAKKNGQAIKEELALLFVHGLLHLLGYDHQKIKEAVIMKELEENILINI